MMSEEEDRLPISLRSWASEQREKNNKSKVSVDSGTRQLAFLQN